MLTLLIFAEMSDSISNLFDAMFTEAPIYRVQGYYASGTFHSCLCAAWTAKDAIENVLAYDNRYVRITSVKPTK